MDDAPKQLSMQSLRGLPLEVRDVFLRGPVLCWSRLGHDVLCGGSAIPVLCSSWGNRLLKGTRTSMRAPLRRLLRGPGGDVFC